jgi:FkbM family methyltransferase
MSMTQSLKQNCPSLYRWLAKMRFMLIRSRITELVKGVKIWIHPHSYVEQQVAKGNFEPKRIQFLCQELTGKEKFIDVGANIGVYTLIAANCGCDVLAFEPDPGNFSRLLGNLQLNALDSRVKTVNKALGSHKTTLPIYSPLSDNHGRVALLETADSKATGKVDVIDLDYYSIPANRVVVKIDVEGFEENVLRGASTWLKQCATDSLWLVEIHTGQGIQVQNILPFFQCFSIAFFDDTTGNLLSNHQTTTGDVILVARKETAQL